MLVTNSDDYVPRHARELVLVAADGSSERRVACRDVAVLSGSFNPLHRGHEALSRAAAEFLNGRVLFELSVVNADKGRLSSAELAARLTRFRTPVAVTAAPLFQDKASLFPGCCFVVGFDTAVRLLDVRYYRGQVAGRDQQLERLRRAGHQFLVAARSIDGGPPQTLTDLRLPAALHALFQALPIERFYEEISSTQLRSRQLPADVPRRR